MPGNDHGPPSGDREAAGGADVKKRLLKARIGGFIRSVVAALAIPDIRQRRTKPLSARCQSNSAASVLMDVSLQVPADCPNPPDPSVR